ncbi:MAG: L-glyceraldehyde 3-phosphate reductase [Bacteroidales bacterium]|jgi:L-glyceraldehyde 3-phosphate reductase|nr:L-glyceraldehyde 3-phosphate reductase [Bacteroidales bacterium]MDD4256579.1 L-glyceraldehyde 3-phosphate reductase [Bacteroidales bacterium]MDD4654405.1 L-glyceraldehyde 3-phosphate reductase [Bacteroidales bacterium]MDD4828453.1 L-glyceraldehyde 3-phosphate reductase [Bacteroidales bacterium]
MTYIPDSQRYHKMKYRRCGRSGILLPSVSLGLWHNFGDVDIFENFRKIAWKAFDNGITHFDLANNYGPPYGSAEINFGRILRTDFAGYRDELIISTKAGYDMWPGPYGNLGSRKYLLASLDQSLKRMGLEYVDIFYSHRPDPDTPPEETMGALARAVHSGKALYAGISNYPPELAGQAFRILKSMGVPCLIHQPKYSMFNRWVEDGLLNLLENEGVGCIAFSPLAQGLLTDKYLNGIPPGSRAGRPSGALQPDAVTPEVLSRVSALNRLAAERGETLAQMAIAWLLKDRRVTSVLVGASRVEQLEENLRALDSAPFSGDELKRIQDILD